MLFVKKEASTYRCLVRSLLHTHTERQTYTDAHYIPLYLLFLFLRVLCCPLRQLFPFFPLSPITKVVVLTSTSFDILLFFFFSLFLSVLLSSPFFSFHVFPLDVIANLPLSRLINTHRARR